MLKTHPIQHLKPSKNASVRNKLHAPKFGNLLGTGKEKPIPVKKWDELTLGEKMKRNWEAAPNKRQLKFLMISSVVGIAASLLVMPWSLIWAVGVLAGLPMTLRPFIKAIQNKEQSPHKHTEDKSI